MKTFDEMWLLILYVLHVVHVCVGAGITALFMPHTISGSRISYGACRLSNGHPDKLSGQPDTISDNLDR